MDRRRLFAEALSRAAQQSDVVAGLSLLDVAEPQQLLRDAVEQAQATIESAAAAELARLEKLEREHASALSAAVRAAVAEDSEVAAQLEALEREYMRQNVDLWFASEAHQRSAGVRPMQRRIRRRLDPGSEGAKSADRLAARAKLRGDIDRLLKPYVDDVRGHLDQWPELAAQEERLQAAREDAVRALTERGMLEVIRRWLNGELQKQTSERYSRDLSEASADGLGQLEDPELEIETRAERRLERLLNQLPSGSVGISGPRGSGKTTLIRAFCRGDRVIGGQLPSVHAMVSAPVRFEPLEFVLHMLERLCSSLLAPGARVDPLEGEREQRRRLKRTAAALCAVAFAGGTAALVIGALLVVHGIQASGLGSERERFLLAGALIAVGVILTAAGFSKLTAVLAAVLTVVGYGVVVVVGATAEEPLSLDQVLLLLSGLVAALVLSLMLSVAVLANRHNRVWLTIGGAALAASGTAIAISAELSPSVSSSMLTGGLLLLCAGVVCGLVFAVVDRPGQDRTWLDEELLRDQLADIERDERLWLEEFEASPAEEHRERLERRKRLANLRTRRDSVRGELEQLRGARGGPAGMRARLRELASTAVHSSAITICASVGGLGVALVALGWADHALDQSLVVGLVLIMVGAPVAVWAIGGWHVVREGMATAEERGAHRVSAWESAGGALARRLRVEQVAREHLRRIRYLQTHTSNWTGKVAAPGSLKLPLSVEATVGGSRSAAEQPLTFPEVLELLKSFLTEVVSGDERAIIGIDELDKIGSEADAERFLNEIKAIFNLANCYFLISVSEDAVASFERRGMPLRDVFDSAFDDMLRVDHFNLDDAEELLSGRTVRVSLPFMALCHALSGGLPRDLIRIARRLFALRDEGEGATLDALCGQVVAEEVLAKRDGTVTAVRCLGQDIDTGRALAWLGSRKRTLLAADGSGDAPPAVPPRSDWPESHAASLKLERLLREYAVFRCFGITLIEFFSDTRTNVDFAGAAQADDESSIDQLARARQAFAIEPELAWERLSAFRRAWDLDPRAGPSCLASYLYSGNGTKRDELAATRERMNLRFGRYNAVVTGPAAPAKPRVSPDSPGDRLP